jgi:hypothetical protein
MADQKKFAAMVKHQLIPAFRAHRFHLNDEEIEDWYLKFKSFPDLAILQSMNEWVDTQSFPPTVADLRKLVSRRLNERPGDYGLEKRWVDPIKKNSRGRALPMPDHIRERIERLQAEARSIMEKEKEQFRANRKEDAERSAPLTPEEKTLKIRKALADYTKRNYEMDKETGKFRKKAVVVISQHEEMIGGKKCKVMKLADGSVEVLGLESLEPL